MAFLDRRAADDVDDGDAYEQLRALGNRINRTAAPQETRREARRLVENIEDENFWPKYLRDIGLFCEAQGIDPTALGVALAIRERFWIEEFITPAEEQWFDLLIVGESDVLVRDGDDQVDFASWVKPQRLEVIRLTMGPSSVRIQIEREDGSLFNAVHKGYGISMSRNMRSLEKYLPEGVRVEVDGATTYRNDPSFEQILSSYRRIERG